jgi:hypothetical protein
MIAREALVMNRTLNRLPRRGARGLAALVSAVALAGLTGCGAWQTLSVRDDEAASVAVRAALRPPAWARSDRPGPGPGFELGFERYRAKDARVLGAGESITLGNQTVTGPDTMGQTATVQQAQLVYTHPLYFGDYFELEPFGGVANISVRYRAEPSQSALRPEQKATRTTVVGGLTPRVRLNEWLAVEARFSFVPLLEGDLYGRNIDLAAVLKPVPQLALRVGYAQRRTGMDFNASNSAWTQLDVRANGPFATVQLEF